MDIFNQCKEINSHIESNNDDIARNQLIVLLDYMKQNQIEYTPIINHLIRLTGLYPYINTDNAILEDRLIYDIFKVGDVIRKDNVIYVIIDINTIAGTGYGAYYTPAQKRYTIVRFYHQNTRSYIYENDQDFDQIRKIGRAKLEWVIIDDKNDDKIDDDLISNYN